MNELSLHDEALKVLSKDETMKGLIETHGRLSAAPVTDYFKSLVFNIIGQQLSMKAADKICERVAKLLDDEISPLKILEISDLTFREAGISRPKISYIKNLSKAVLEETINIKIFDARPDEEIIADLIKVKGIGRWTAEMFLIFNLCREDIFSQKDGGLNSALKKLYNDGNMLSGADAQKIMLRFSPYRSVASLYLWKSLGSN
jgi:DNA-3-methyladenine glycosylase II